MAVDVGRLGLRFHHFTFSPRVFDAFWVVLLSFLAFLS